MNDYAELTRQLWAHKYDRWTGAAKAMTAQTATIAEQSAQIDAQIDALTDAVLEERERCAVLCDNEAKTREEAAHATHGRGTPAYGRQMAGITAAKNCARAIRNPAK